MDWLVISNILLWIGFIAMVLVNLALARQIGVLYERVAPAGALMMNQKLTVGRRCAGVGCVHPGRQRSQCGQGGRKIAATVFPVTRLPRLQ